MPHQSHHLPTPSKEQQTIIQHLTSGHHVIVDAVAGSGKSTVVLMASQQLYSQHPRPILQITYNAHLRKEIQEKAKSCHLPHLEIHTYHSLAVKYYNPAAFTDEILRAITTANSPPIRPLPPFQLIVIDEIQDMSFVYYGFIRKMMRDISASSPFQLLLLGDEKQGIYEFRGSDARFLTFAEKIWPFGKTAFHRCKLQTSYRLTNAMAQYINTILLGEERLLACKEGPPVTYVRHNERMLLNAIVGKINMFLQSGEFRPDDIFILAPSIRSKYVKSVENILAERGFPLYISTNDDEDIHDDRILQHKIVFSSFHSAKGRQRPIVFVLDYDYGFMMQNFIQENWHFYKRDETHCPNQVYVACSRAEKALILVENTRNRPLPFLQIPHTHMHKEPYLKYEGPCYFENTPDVCPPRHRKLSPTDLVKHLDDSILDLCTTILHRIFVKTHPAVAPLNFVSVVPNHTGDKFEEVSHINGIALPFLFYSRVFSASYQSYFYDLTVPLWKHQKTFHKMVQEHLPVVCETTADYLKSALFYHAGKENILSTILQIRSFDWLCEADIDVCVERMKGVLGTACPEHIEKFIDIPADKKNPHYRRVNIALRKYFPQHLFFVKAYIDLIMPDALWELKCVAQLSTEHYLQTVCYAWLWRTMYPQDCRPFRLFNIRNGECWTLQGTYPELTELMVLMIQSKMLAKERKTDEDFLMECGRGFI